ncbi:MAG: hypothetical protein JXQ87_00480 [Bacteroidia bacterium]
MKNLLPLGLLLAFTTSIYAQSVKKEPITFKYIQYPLQNQGADVKTFNSTVLVKYEEEVKKAEEAEKAEHERLVAEDKAKFEQLMSEYPAVLAEYEAKYAEQMKTYEAAKKEYDEKSAGLKVVEKQLLEKDTEPRKPGYYPPGKPSMYNRTFNPSRQQKIFDAEMLSSSYLNLEGFTQNENGDLKIEVTMFGFEQQDATIKSEERTVSRNDNLVKVNYYSIVHKYRHPINLKVTTKNGKTLIDEILPEISEWTTYTSSSSERRPYINKDELSEAGENAIMEKNMKIIQNYINDNYAYPVKERTIDLYYVKDRKVDYSDYQSAYETIYAAYNQYYDENADAVEKIKKSVGIWENALKESDPDDRKARVDNDVTLYTLISLAEAHSWLGNYNEAEGYLNKTVSLKRSNKEEALVDAIRTFIKDQKVRDSAKG